MSVTYLIFINLSPLVNLVLFQLLEFQPNNLVKLIFLDVDGVFLHEGEHAVEIDDVGLDEEVVGARLDVGQVGQVAGVGEFVDVDDAVVGIFPDEKPDDVRADEPGAPGDDDIALEIHGYEFCSVKLLIHTRSESVQ